MWEISKTSITLVQGDITECDVDAIVNAANTKLILGAGVAGAIRKKGGPSIQKECSEVGPIELGHAAITTGGDLKAKYVIHAASMTLGGKATEVSLKKSILNSLQIGSINNIESIAFPAIGTGIAGFPISKCAKIMVECFISFLKHNDHIFKQIEVVLFTQNDYIIFNKIFKELINEFQ